MINRNLVDNDDELDNTPIGFGKYSETTPNELADEDPGYLLNAYRKRVYICSQKLAKACEMLVEADG